MSRSHASLRERNPTACIVALRVSFSENGLPSSSGKDECREIEKNDQSLPAGRILRQSAPQTATQAPASGLAVARLRHDGLRNRLVRTDQHAEQSLNDDEHVDVVDEERHGKKRNGERKKNSREDSASKAVGQPPDETAAMKQPARSDASASVIRPSEMSATITKPVETVTQPSRAGAAANGATKLLTDGKRMTNAAGECAND